MNRLAKVLSATTLLAAALPVSAQGLVNPLRVNSLMGLLNVILSYIVEIGSIVVILMLVYTGFLFVTAQGNPQKLAQVRTMFMWTIIGGVIILGAQAIAMGVQATVNAISS